MKQIGIYILLLLTIFSSGQLRAQKPPGIQWKNCNNKWTKNLLWRIRQSNAFNPITPI